MTDTHYMFQQFFVKLSTENWIFENFILDGYQHISQNKSERYFRKEHFYFWRIALTSKKSILRTIVNRGES